MGICLAVVVLAVESMAQSTEGFIYGKVYTTRNTYTGPIRWGGEEVLWTDLFNASKSGDKYQKMVPEKKDDDDDSWFSYDWSFNSIWEDKYTSHQFTCQFGNMAEIETRRDSRAIIRFKNGGEIMVDGEGYNDIGAKIQVVDGELGTMSIDWDRITKIEFMPTPAKLPAVFGVPLYGTVESARREKFTGFIVWDNDERLTADRLDGDDDDDDVSIKFADITSIEKEGRGSRVALKSGRELYLTGSNDVNSENRGVLVVTPEYGVVQLSWEAFRKVTFSQPSNTGMAYGAFTSPRSLRGVVSRLEGDDVEGQIIFDIDETLDFELIEGDENDIQYMIPLKNIRKITPKNHDFSLVELSSGKSLLLGGRRDISSDNGGVLVFSKGKKEPYYISWRKINEIIFK